MYFDMIVVLYIVVVIVEFVVVFVLMIFVGENVIVGKKLVVFGKWEFVQLRVLIGLIFGLQDVFLCVFGLVLVYRQYVLVVRYFCFECGYVFGFDFVDVVVVFEFVFDGV